VEIQIRAGAQPRSDGEENKAVGAYKEQNENLCSLVEMKRKEQIH
jgi:hypothetical protein